MSIVHKDTGSRQRFIDIVDDAMQIVAYLKCLSCHISTLYILMACFISIMCLLRAYFKYKNIKLDTSKYDEKTRNMKA